MLYLVNEVVMTSRRQTQVAETLVHLAGEFIARETNGRSLITVTRADIAPDLKRATLYVSVLPENAEEDALDFLKRQRSTFRDHLKAKSSLRYLPFIDFTIDYGEKNRQMVDEALRK